MLTALEINLQIALLALGCATVIGIYLYSRFHDKNLSHSRAESMISKPHINMLGPHMTDEEYQSGQNIPDYLAGIDSNRTPKVRVDNPSRETSHTFMEDQECSENTETGSATGEKTEPIIGLQEKAGQPDETEHPPVLREQVDIAEMIDGMEDEDGSNLAQGTNAAATVDPAGSCPDLTQQNESAAALDQHPEDEHEEAGEQAATTSETAGNRIEASPGGRFKIPKLTGLGIFRRFGNPESGLDTELESDTEENFEFDDVPDVSSVEEVRATGEYGASEIPANHVHEKARGMQPQRFEYPQIPGFNSLSQIDYWVRLFGGGDHGKETLQAQYMQLFGAFQNPTRIYGVRTTDQQWVNVLNEPDSTRFVVLIISLQLIDQRGAVTRKELKKFTDRVTQFSESTGKDVTFMAPLESAIQQANVLSECIEMFNLPSMILVKPEDPGQLLNGRDIANCASRLGLEPHKTNYFVRTKTARKKKIVLYGVASLSNDGIFDFERMDNREYPGLVFFFRPLIHEAPGSVLSEMATTAKSFAGRIGAKAVTRCGEELTSTITHRMRSDIEKRSREIAACGLKSGGSAITRIFESEIVVSE